MKSSFRPTLWIGVGVTLLAAFVVYDMKKNGTGGDSSEAGEQKPLFEFVKEDVKRIVLHNSGGDVEIARVGEAWRVVKPIEDMAEAGAVDSFLYLAISQKGKVFRTDEDGAVNWNEYGLEPEVSTILLEGRDQSKKVAVSSKNAFDGSFYVRSGDEVLLADKGLAQIAQRDANSFRARRVWREDDTVILGAEAEIDYEGLKAKYKFKSEGEKWTMEPSPGFALDMDKVTHWVKRVQNLIPAEIARDGLEEADKKEFLLVKPTFKMTLHFGDKDKPKSWTLVMGQDRAEDVFVYSDSRPTIYRAGENAVRQLRVAPEFFRDGKTPFKFDLEKVTTAEIAHPKFNETLKKEALIWTSAGGDKDGKVNEEKLTQLFQNLSSLEAQEFVVRSPSFKPDRKVALKDSSGKTVIAVEWGGEYKSTLPQNRGMKMRLVRSSLEKVLLAIPAEKMDPLIMDPLVSKPQPATQPAEAK